MPEKSSGTPRMLHNSLLAAFLAPQFFTLSIARCTAAAGFGCFRAQPMLTSCTFILLYCFAIQGSALCGNNSEVKGRAPRLQDVLPDGSGVSPALPHGKSTLPIGKEGLRGSRTLPFRYAKRSLVPHGHKSLPRRAGTNRKRLQSLSQNNTDFVTRTYIYTGCSLLWLMRTLAVLGSM